VHKHARPHVNDAVSDFRRRNYGTARRNCGILHYKRWVIKKVYEAFQEETGIGRPAAATMVAVARDDEMRSLAHIREMGLAIAAFAEQQMAFAARQQVHEGRIGVLEEGQGRLDARLDRAAGVVGGLVRSVQALEQRLAPGNVLSEEQAAEVSDRVKTVAEALTARDVAAGAAQLVWVDLSGALQAV